MTMELKQAEALLTELADGVDPLTGECLPADSVCNRPEIIRALHCVLRYVSDRPKRSAPLPNAGKPWTEADEAALMQMFDVGCSMEEMQARFQRTRKSPRFSQLMRHLSVVLLQETENLYMTI